MVSPSHPEETYFNNCQLIQCMCVMLCCAVATAKVVDKLCVDVYMAVFYVNLCVCAYVCEFRDFLYSFSLFLFYG